MAAARSPPTRTRCSCSATAPVPTCVTRAWRRLRLSWLVGTSRCCDSTSRSWSRVKVQSVRARLPPRRLLLPSRRRGRFRTICRCSRRPLVWRPHGIARDPRTRSRRRARLDLLFVSAASGGRAGHDARDASARSSYRCCFCRARAMRWPIAICCAVSSTGIGPRAELVWLDTADHGYKVLKRSRARSDTVFEELADAAAAFVRRVC